MKYYLIIIGLFFFVIKKSNGQNSNNLFFDEFQISLNKTNLQNDNTEDKYGFGFGAYHLFIPDKRINLLLGLEFNRTSQLKKIMYEGHFAHATDLTYNINCFSIPVGFRLNFGSKMKAFFETGGFVDLNINSNRKGIMHSYFPDENNLINYTETEIDEKVELSNTIGLYIGFGILIPILKYELIVKPDYKFGVNKLYSYQNDIFNRYFRINIILKIK